MNTNIYQLRQVLRIYTTRWEFWWSLVLCLIFLLISPGFRSDPKSSDFVGVFFTSCFPSLMLGSIIGNYLKQQFANPRARLFPDFANAHLIVPGVLITILIVIEIIVFVRWNGFYILIITSLTLSMFTWGIFASYLHPSIFGWLLQIPIFLLIFNINYISGLFFSVSPIASIVLICICISLLYTLTIRLANLNEETPEYSYKMQTRYLDPSSRADNRERLEQERQSIARSHLRGWLHDFLFHIVFRRLPNKGRLRNMLLWQFPGNFMGILTALLQFGLVILLRPMSLAPAFNYLLSFYMILLGVCALSVSWMRRWPQLARESLYPRDRKNFISNIFCNSTFDILVNATGYCFGIVVCLIVFPSIKTEFGSVLLYIAMIFAQFILMCYTMLMLISFRESDILVALFGCIIAGFISLISVGTIVFSNDWVIRIFGIAFTLFAIAGIYRLAFRQWYYLELD